MTLKKSKQTWETISAPKDAVTKQFTSKNGKKFCEVVLPNTLPDGTPDIPGWHFCMPAGCVRDAENGSKTISFPATWITVRFFCPFKKGQKTQTIEFTTADALSLIRKAFVI